MMKTSKTISLGLALCALMACTKQAHRDYTQAPIKVKTTVVAPQAGSATSRYVGTIEPTHETPLSLETTGRVTAINVKNGTRVHKGQVLLTVDNTQALNALQGAEATLQHAQDGYNRVSQVHAKGVVSDQKMVEVESQLTQAKSIYAAAKKRLEECTLVAPCDGVVNGLTMEKGQTVIPGTKLCSILDVSGFNVRFTVPEAEVRNLGKTGKVECAAVDSVFPVTIREKSVAANAVTHTYDVIAHISGGTDVLMAGMVAKVHVQNTNRNTDEEQMTNIVIPAKCILLTPDGHTVWVVENGTAVRRGIVIDGYQADGVRVKSGLQSGDTLITEGYQKLYKDCKVIED